jgi:regulator of sigma E protease
MSWVLTILGIMALIVLHELGHFAVAKAVGMRVERFSLFFPPRLFGIRRGETDYSIGAIPAGGYVKITGMTFEEIKDMDLRLAHRAYCLQPPWKRAAVILAGPAVNLLIAFVIFGAILLSGSLNGETTLARLAPAVNTFSDTSQVAVVERGKPADGALQPEDRIVAVDGRPATVAQARERIASHRCAGAQVAGCTAATPVRLTVVRNGVEVQLSLYPRYSATEKRMLIGFGFATAARTFGAPEAAGTAAREMWHITTQTITGFGRALTQPKVRHEVSSIIGIGRAAHETVNAGAGYALVFLGFISLVLAVINLFPFLPLDGGHLLWAVAEKLRGRRISLQAMYRYSSVGILLLLFLVVNGVSNDISRLTG